MGSPAGTKDVLLVKGESGCLLQDNVYITECVQRGEFLFILFIAFGGLQDVNGIGMTFCSIRKACDAVTVRLTHQAGSVVAKLNRGTFYRIAVAVGDNDTVDTCVICSNR